MIYSLISCEIIAQHELYYADFLIIEEFIYKKGTQYQKKFVILHLKSTRVVGSMQKSICIGLSLEFAQFRIDGRL